MTVKTLMLQGTGSDVGKSILTAALCRIARRRGLRVAPFKPQNMSNNAAVCKTGGEIGRAQAIQAFAAGIEPHTDMNPVLLKPQTDQISQIVVQGKVMQAMEAADYMVRRYRLIHAVMESFNRLAQHYDLILVEGAGSPAEINLRDRDIANMGFARKAGIPVCLIGDIEKGGVIASLVGTKYVLDPSDAAMIGGFIINKFRGDPRLFDNGVIEIETRTDWPCLGVIPWLQASSRLPAEDALIVDKAKVPNTNTLTIAAPMLSRIANFDDADPLKMEPGINFNWIPPGRPIPRNTDMVILFGTKSTLGDLVFLREQGWDHDIIAHRRSGGHILGICGGYQILGRKIIDELGVDGIHGQADGLGLLDVNTVMRKDKCVTPIEGKCALTGALISGYEIHTGRTDGIDTQSPFAWIGDSPDGATSPDGRVQGTYIHGAFTQDIFRRSWLEKIGASSEYNFCYMSHLEHTLETLADAVEMALDIDALFALAKSPGWKPENR